MLESFLVQGAPDGAHPPVHHVRGAITSAPAWAWETAVRASRSRVGSLSTSGSPSPQDAAVAVGGVLADAGVRHQEQVGVGPLEGPGGLLHDPVLIEGPAAGLVLGLREPEQEHGGDAQVDRSPASHHAPQRPAPDPRHGGHFQGAVDPASTKRGRSAGRRRGASRGSGAQGFRATEAAEATERKGHYSHFLFLFRCYPRPVVAPAPGSRTADLASCPGRASRQAARSRRPGGRGPWWGVEQLLHDGVGQLLHGVPLGGESPARRPA